MDVLVAAKSKKMEESETSIVSRLQAAKSKSGKSYAQIAAETGLTNVYVAQVLRRQAQVDPEIAQRLRLSLPELSQDLLDEISKPPARFFRRNLIQEPTVYRLKEAVMHFGDSIKEIINEEFGDGIMSDIDFYCSVDKVKGVDGKDRVVVTFDGKYFSYSEPAQNWDDYFAIKEATINDFQEAFRQNKLTSRQLVQFYLNEIKRLNPLLNAVIEVNPDALNLADKADYERNAVTPGSLSRLHGIPILLKDNIATKDKLNTTSGSFALLGSVVPRDAGVVTKLRNAGAIILGKASLTQWSNFRSTKMPSGWSSRGGQGKNPYTISDDTCGSSSGSAISVAANLVAVSLGTETNGSILCPASMQSVVSIKPTVGLTSRAGVIPISLRQDTVGSIGRTVSDAVYVLDAIVGVDPNDQATVEASKYIPSGGYKQFLNANGLNGKRLGILRDPYFEPDDTALNGHFETLRQRGAVLIDQLQIANISDILDMKKSGQETALLAEFKSSLNAYLKDLVSSPVHSLAEVIAFNEKNADQEKTNEFGQDLFELAEKTNGTDSEEVRNALAEMERFSRDGIEKLMNENNLDAWMSPTPAAYCVLAIGGFPGVVVPAGYDEGGFPFGITFGGLKGSEPKLIEIAYDCEQTTRVRRPPTEYLPLNIETS